MLAKAQKEETLPTHFQTVDEFEAWEQQHVTEGSFEFVQGRIIEKESMNQEEYFIVKFLNRQFIQTAAFQKGDELTPEMDSYVDETRRRRPDLAYFTQGQIQQTRTGLRQRTTFAIETLSDSESYQNVLDKIQDYFDGGAQLVWYIAPRHQHIYAYTSPETLTVYKIQDTISAAPVVADLQFVVADMFA